MTQSDQIVLSIGLPLGTDRSMIQGVLFWMPIGFVVSHELAHHTHGHWIQIEDGCSTIGNLRRQARDVEADGWAAYLTLNHWVLAGGRSALLEPLDLKDARTGFQDHIAFACFVAAQAALLFFVILC